ncbi:hypothetical protein [Methylotuvimicrobium buryatense]|uniref:hypothetical protein n=1 Tax=Methylotuvimicrobium buryatense TaxID=95641 RepID=UPI0003738508|nr:hypothetical protein [Methylotuvimicrobium buryatense]
MSIGIIFQTMERTGRMDELVRFSLAGQSDLILLGHIKSRTGQRLISRRLATITGCSVWMEPEACGTNISCLIAPINFSQPPASSLSQATVLARANNNTELMALHVYFASSVIRYTFRTSNFGSARGRRWGVRQRLCQHGAGIEPTWTYSRRPLADIPVPNFDLRWV